MGSRQDFSDREFERELQSALKDFARDNDAMDEIHHEASKDRFNNNTFDRILDDAKIIYQIYLDSEECRDYSEKRVFELSCEGAVFYHGALISDDDDRIYDSLTSSQKAKMEEYLVLGKAIDRFEDRTSDSRRSRGRDRDRDSRDDRGGRSNTRGSSRRDTRDDRDDRDRGRGRDRGSRSNGRSRSSYRGDNIGRNNSVRNHLDNIEASTQATNKGNDDVRQTRAEREVPSAAPASEILYLPLLDSFDSPFGPSSKKPWPSIFHADTQLPLYLAQDNGTKSPDILEDVVLSLTDLEAVKLKAIPIPDHATHLLFRRRNPSGYQGDASNMVDVETRLKQKEESLQQVYSLLEEDGDIIRAKEGAKLPGAFLRKMVVVPEVINASTFKDKVWAMIDFMDQRVRAIDNSASCEDLLSMATVEIDADSVIIFDTQEAFDNFEGIIQAILMSKSYAGFAAAMVDLAGIIPRRIWNVINDDLTNYVTEILQVELALDGASIESFTRNVESLEDALESAYGRGVSEAFSDTAIKLISNCMQFTHIPDTWQYRHYRMETIVMLPLVAEDVDYALASPSGVGMVSKELMPALHAGLTKVIAYAAKNKSRCISLITLDGAVVSVHSSPLSKGCVLLSNRNWN